MKCRYCKAEHDVNVFISSRGACPSCSIRDMGIAMDCRIQDEKVEMQEPITEDTERYKIPSTSTPAYGIGNGYTYHSIHDGAMSVCTVSDNEDAKKPTINRPVKRVGKELEASIHAGQEFYVHGVKYIIERVLGRGRGDPLRTVIIKENDKDRAMYIDGGFFENVFKAIFLGSL